jgi:hypothetical protein
MSTNTNTPNEKLQAKLRELVHAEGLTAVSRRLDIGREALARYAANYPLQTSTFRGIEVSIEAIEPLAKEA